MISGCNQITNTQNYTQFLTYANISNDTWFYFQNCNSTDTQQVDSL